jgi:hypothetical protein
MCNREPVTEIQWIGNQFWNQIQCSNLHKYMWTPLENKIGQANRAAIQHMTKACNFGFRDESRPLLRIIRRFGKHCSCHLNIRRGSARKPKLYTYLQARKLKTRIWQTQSLLVYLELTVSTIIKLRCTIACLNEKQTDWDGTTSFAL